MGDAADDIIEGRTCSTCGEFFEGEHGYPVVCKQCWREMTPRERKQYQRANYPTLGEGE